MFNTHLIQLFISPSSLQKGTITGDTTIGRQLLDAVASVPKVDRQQFEQMFNNNIQDLLMVVFLSNLTRTQLAIAERLQSIV